MPELKDALLDLGREALEGLKPSPEDRAKIDGYLKGLAQAVAAGDRATAQGFADALNLKVAQYEVKAGLEAEAALRKVLVKVAEVALASIG